MKNPPFNLLVLVVVLLLWLSGRALVAQARGVLGSTTGGCQPFYFPLFSPHNMQILARYSAMPGPILFVGIIAFSPCLLLVSSLDPPSHKEKPSEPSQIFGAFMTV